MISKDKPGRSLARSSFSEGGLLQGGFVFEIIKSRRDVLKQF
jgi:hypothetical protein